MSEVKTKDNVIVNRPVSNPRVQMQSTQHPVNIVQQLTPYRKVTRGKVSKLSDPSPTKFVKGANIVVLPLNQIQFNYG